MPYQDRPLLPKFSRAPTKDEWKSMRIRPPAPPERRRLTVPPCAGTVRTYVSRSEFRPISEIHVSIYTEVWMGVVISSFFEGRRPQPFDCFQIIRTSVKMPKSRKTTLQQYLRKDRCQRGKQPSQRVLELFPVQILTTTGATLPQTLPKFTPVCHIGPNSRHEISERCFLVTQLYPQVFFYTANPHVQHFGSYDSQQINPSILQGTEYLMTYSRLRLEFVPLSNSMTRLLIVMVFPIQCLRLLFPMPRCASWTAGTVPRSLAAQLRMTLSP
ncbi:unnamed protein product [Somion occarium]|uniref:Uncharacterized protein n=1 Tax=Somion occarium TaxID=3059160 RepID=A0ABP1EBR5_9APHY